MTEPSFYCARFYVTYRCNSRCSYCNVWQNPAFKNIAELSAADAKLLIKQCYEHGVRYVDFTGGEPTLYPHLAEVIGYAKGLGIKTEVTSNCIASSSRQKMLEVAAAADKFNTSLDTLDCVAYRQIRGVDACANVRQAVAEIAAVRSPKIMTVVTESNINELDSMIAYAQNHKAMIYLSPMFPYMDKNGAYQISAYIPDIINRIFAPYTVVLLHFMEFFRTSAPHRLPPCSANRHTLTFAPDGNLVLPCYHAIKEKISWNKNLSAALNSPKFQEYAQASGALPSCRGCCVIPYFGISFNYQLNKYFLLQSFSEKLSHLKRDCLNPLLAELCPDTAHLLAQLGEMQKIVRTLSYAPDMGACRRGTELYPAEIQGNNVITPVYKEPLPLAVYAAEQKAADCWQLSLVPHRYFDRVDIGIFRPLAAEYAATPTRKKAAILREAMEFAVRWWKFYTAAHFRLDTPADISADAAWLSAYFDRLDALGNPAFAPIISEGRAHLAAAASSARAA